MALIYGSEGSGSLSAAHRCSISIASSSAGYVFDLAGKCSLTSRSSLRRPATLPHYPMVLHRGGFPDGS
jgi:hypothetical protein